MFGTSPTQAQLPFLSATPPPRELTNGLPVAQPQQHVLVPPQQQVPPFPSLTTTAPSASTDAAKTAAKVSAPISFSNVPLLSPMTPPNKLKKSHQNYSAVPAVLIASADDDFTDTSSSSKASSSSSSTAGSASIGVLATPSSSIARSAPTYSTARTLALLSARKRSHRSAGLTSPPMSDSSFPTARNRAQSGGAGKRLITPANNGTFGAAAAAVARLRRASSLDNGGEAVMCEDAPTMFSDSDCYTVPSSDQLKRMSSVELAAVNDFIVGHRKYARVRFTEAVDLRGVVFDDIIRFDEKFVEIYKDDSNKPRIGEGLNHPAVVHLYGCYPAEGESLEAYKERLHYSCKKNGSEFLWYFPDTGEWIQRVPHFTDITEHKMPSDGKTTTAESRDVVPPTHEDLFEEPSPVDPVVPHEPEQVGLLSDEVDALKPLVDQNTDHPEFFLVSSDDQNQSTESITEEEGRKKKKKNNKKRPERKISKDEDKDDGNTLDKNALKNAAALQGLLSSNSSLFNRSTLSVHDFETVCRFGSSTTTPHKETPATSSAVAPVKQAAIAYGPFSIFTTESVFGKNAMSFVPAASSSQPIRRQPSTGMKRKPQQKLEGIVIDKEEEVPPPLVTPISQSCAVKDGLCLDESRGFRCGWSNSGVIATHVARVVSSAKSSNVHWIVTPTQVASKSFGTVERDMLVAFRECSAHISSKDGQNVSWQLEKPDELIDIFKNKLSDRERALWSLIGTVVMNATQPEVEMRKKVCDWLYETLHESAVQHGNSSFEAGRPYDAILWYLSGGELGLSLQVAEKIGDLGLACIISQLDGGMDVRELVKDELKHWDERHDSENEGVMELRVVYCVLGGFFDDQHDYLSQLDWRAVLGLNVWYKCYPSATLSEILHAFKDTMKASNGSCSPAASWQRKSGEGSNNCHKAETTFWLLKLASLCTKEQFDADNDESERHRLRLLKRIVSQIDGHTDPNDPSLHGRGLLMAFFIMHVLRSMGFGIPDKLLWNVTVQVADELEQAGMWKDALLVYLQAQTDDSTEALCQPGVMSVLTRCYPTASKEEQSYVQNDLHVPSHWLALADAWYLQSCGMVWKAVDCFIKGGMYVQAHQLLLDSIAFPVIVEHGSIDIANLVRVLRILRKSTQTTKPASGRVENGSDQQQVLGPAEKRAKLDNNDVIATTVSDQEAAMPGWEIGGGALLTFLEECSEDRLEEEEYGNVRVDLSKRKETLASLARLLQRRSAQLEKQEREHMNGTNDHINEILVIERAALGLMAESVARCLMRVHLTDESVLSLPAYQILLQVLPLPTDVRNTFASDSAMEFVSSN